MASNNNPPGYTPPAVPDMSTTSIPSPAQLSSVPLAAVTMTVFCQISSNCQGYTSTSKWLYCQQYNYDDRAYFSCICKYTNSLSRNEYFNSSCVLSECDGAEARKQFLSKYQYGCFQRGLALVDISDEWAPYNQNPEYSLPLQPSSPSPSTTTGTSSQPGTSTRLSTLSQATTAISTSILLAISTTQSTTTQYTKTTTSITSSAMPTPTGPADEQIPICGISQNCMIQKPQGEASCSPGDLECICNTSNSLENNTEFDQQCVLDACYGDIGREEFLDSLFYHCKKVNKQLVDIPKRWEPYLPATFPSATPDAAPPVDSKAPVPTSARAPLKLSGGAIGGIVAAAVLVLLIVLGLIKLWWDTKKKANTLRKDNAKLQDATNPEGMSMRINTLISDSSPDEFASRRETTSAGRGAETSIYGASAYNDATLIGSPRSMHVYPDFGHGTATRGYKEYGAKTEDYEMSVYDDKYPGPGRQYSRDHSQHELPDNDRRDYQTVLRQENSDDDSVSRYSVRRNSYGDETVDLQRRRGQEATSEWEEAQSGEWKREQEEDRIRRSARS